MVKSQRSMIAAIVASLATVVMVLASRAAGQTVSVTGNVVAIDLPATREHVVHRVNGVTYKQQVDFSRDLLAEKKITLRVSSQEHGAWDSPVVVSGVFVRATSNVTTLGATPPTFARPYVHEFALAYTPDAATPERHYQQQLAEVEKRASRLASKSEGGLKWRTAVRNQMTLMLKDYDKAGIAALRVLNKPLFLRLITDPEPTMQMLCKWIALDELLQFVSFKPQQGLNEQQILAMWDEAIGAIEGRLKTADEARVLLPEQFEILAAACRVRLVHEFTPLAASAQSDLGWSSAPELSLAAGGVSGVKWRGAAGVEPRLSEWLAMKTTPPDAPLEVEAGASPVVWCEVQSESGWRYLRVAPREAGKPAEFELLVRLKTADGAQVEVTSAAPAKVRFPF